MLHGFVDPDSTPMPLRAAVALPLAFIAAACGGGPVAMFPGGALSGEVVEEPVSDWSFVDSNNIELETRPGDPYSVVINYIVRDGDLFIDPAEGRTWFEYLKEDPRVRVRIGDRVYLLNAVLVGRPGELEGFDPDRFVYRLDPREE
jgi:hypothetical protein